MYERASRGEERLFLETAEEVVNEIDEPSNWKKQDPKKHPGGRTSPIASDRYSSFSCSWSITGRSVERWKRISTTIRTY